jgi:hypothetical protein
MSFFNIIVVTKKVHIVSMLLGNGEWIDRHGGCCSGFSI